MRLNVGVIFGGKSIEHEVSILSAIEIMEQFDENKYNVIPIYMDKNNNFFTGAHLKDLSNFRDIALVKRYAKKIAIVKDGNNVIIQRLGILRKNLYKLDILFPIGHSTYLEDGSIQGFLNILNIPYVGPSVIASAIGQDKVLLKQILLSNNIPTSNYVWFYEKEFLSDKKKILDKINTLKYPVIIKPANLGSSVGIAKIYNDEGLIPSIKEALKFDRKVLVEEVIENIKEVNISVLGGIEKQEISPVEEIGFNDNYSKIDVYHKVKELLKIKFNIYNGTNGIKTANQRQEPIISKEMLEDMKKYATLTFKAIDCRGVARIDFLIDDKNKKIYVSEINTIPASLSANLWATKKKPAKELIDDLINIAINEHKNKNEKTYSFEKNLLELYDYDLMKMK